MGQCERRPHHRRSRDRRGCGDPRAAGSGASALARSPGPILAAQPAQRANWREAEDRFALVGHGDPDRRQRPGIYAGEARRRRAGVRGASRWRRSRPARRAGSAATCTVERAGRASPSDARVDLIDAREVGHVVTGRRSSSRRRTSLRPRLRGRP